MNEYAAFLRGINIGGKNKIDMPNLKTGFEELGFINVSTFLNSGNVKFSSYDTENRTQIENMIKERFGLNISVYVISLDSLKNILSNSPDWWGQDSKETYDNLIFILSDESPDIICDLVGSPSKDLELVQTYGDVIFWTFDRNKYQKCNWWKKTASIGIAEKLTIRTANTIKKICN